MQTNQQLIDNLAAADPKDREAFSAAYKACTPIHNQDFVDSFFFIAEIIGYEMDECSLYNMGVRGGESYSELKAISQKIINADNEAIEADNEAKAEAMAWEATQNAMNASWAYNH